MTFKLLPHSNQVYIHTTLEATQDILKNTQPHEFSGTPIHISLKALNYKAMKSYITNRNEFLKLELPLPQPKKQISELKIESSTFVQANQLMLKKRFHPPSKLQQQQNDKPTSKPKAQMEDSLIQRIESDIIEQSDQPTLWQDIAGLEHVREQVMEIAIWPLENPKLFEGIISPGSGLLLFGPPGTGKTMIGKAIASEGQATFFSIKASTLTSKYIGEGEKTVKTLFMLAAQRQPSVIFFDEIDSLLCARSDKDNETSRQIKTEFMVQLEGANRTGQERIVFIGATNRPQELDDAIKRRFQKKIYIPLPNKEGRKEYFQNLLCKESIKLNEVELDEVIKLTHGYSGADIRNLSREACMFPVRDAARMYNIKTLTADQIRATTLDDFKRALSTIKPTVNRDDLKGYLQWNQQFGSYNYNAEFLDT